MDTAARSSDDGRSVLGAIAGRLRNRPDREHEMVFNRLIIGTLLMIYLVVSGLLHTMETQGPIIADAVYVCIALGFFLHMLAWPQTSHARRVVGMIVDIGALSYCLYVGGQTTAVLWPIYLWIMFGNGFRFGNRYLFASMALGMAGFGTLLVVSDYWSSTSHLGIGLLLGLLVLPAYTSTLIRNLNKARRQAEEASKAKSSFLASVSHELRTPLNAVIGMSDLLRDSELDAEQNDMANTISASGRSLLSLIEGILDFSRIEAGRMPINMGEFDLYALLHKVRAMLAPAARKKGLRLGLHVSVRTPQRVTGDAKHIEEVLINLVGNAVKFTAEGHVLISVDAIAEHATASTIRFEVSDTGIGIAPEARGRIFDSFTQADETIINRFGGTGLGLAISKQLVGLQGGRMDVDSELGAGSTFWFELDMERAPSPATDARTTLVGANAILLSLDPQTAAALRPRLAAMGVAALDAVDAGEARARMAEQRGDRALRPAIFVGEASLGMVREIVAELPTGVVGPGFILAGASGAELSPRQRLDCVSALSVPLDDRDLTAALKIALSAGSFGESSLRDIAAAKRRSLTVLIADDNHTNQKVIGKILERGGHRCKVVDNGEQAVDALLAGGVDIVFMDVNMPVMNGIEATKLYRFAALGRPRVPIVALTADATPEAKARCEEAGMDGCVTKPIEAGELFRIIDTLVPAEAEQVAGEAGDVAFLGDTVTEISAHPRFKPEARAIDAAVIAQLEELGGKTFVTDLAREFLDEGAKIIAEIRQSVADGDYSYFRDRAHAMRSGAANIGALRLYELCLALRVTSDADFTRIGGEKAREIEDEFARVRRELGEYCGDPDLASAPPDDSPARDATIRSLPVGPSRTSAGSAQR